MTNITDINPITMNNLRIKEILKQQGHTQKWLAEQMGITPIALNKILTRDKPNFDNVVALSKALGVTKAELYADYKTAGSITCPNCGYKITIKAE